MFWNFIGNPLYRMLERSIVEDCRHSEAYQKKLFERIEDLIGAISPIRELLKEREEREEKNRKQKKDAIRKPSRAQNSNERTC